MRGTVEETNGEQGLSFFLQKGVLGYSYEESSMYNHFCLRIHALPAFFRLSSSYYEAVAIVSNRGHADTLIAFQSRYSILMKYCP